MEEYGLENQQTTAAPSGLDADGVRRVAFEDTEHYRVTRAFMTDHRGMVRKLLESDEQPLA